MLRESQHQGVIKLDSNAMSHAHQELGPWCAAAALSAVLQPSVRNMYTSGDRRQQGADALGLPDAPPLGLADAWSAPLLAECCVRPHCWRLLSSSGRADIPAFCRLLPADVALPQGGSLPKPDGQASDEEQGAVLEALRSAVLAVAELLVPNAAQRTKLLAGEVSVLLER
jgi:hypothetical protein